MPHAEPEETAIPFRYVSPTMLLGCLGLFFLPWTQIQCGPARTPDSMPLAWQEVVQQTGFEAARGEFSVRVPGARERIDRFPEHRPEPAPLLWVFVGAVLSGMAVGFAAPPGVGRKLTLTACCLLAIGCAGGQAALGFPIEKSIPALGREANREQEAQGAPEFLVFRTSLQFGFYGVLLLAAGATVTALIEPTEEPGAARRRRRRRADDDDEERDRGRDWEEHDRPPPRREY